MAISYFCVLTKRKYSQFLLEFLIMSGLVLFWRSEQVVERFTFICL